MLNQRLACVSNLSKLPPSFFRNAAALQIPIGTSPRLQRGCITFDAHEALGIPHRLHHALDILNGLHHAVVVTNGLHHSLEVANRLHHTLVITYGLHHSLKSEVVVEGIPHHISPRKRVVRRHERWQWEEGAGRRDQVCAPRLLANLMVGGEVSEGLALNP